MILKETILSAFNERGTLLKWLKKVEKLITEKVLVKPVNNPQSTEIVAVDNTGAQVMLGVGAGLTVDNGVLKFADVYDGTVIIEKAESVLGLRMFKENLSVFGEVDYTSDEVIDNFYAENYITIPPLTDKYGNVLNGVTPLINFTMQIDEAGNMQTTQIFLGGFDGQYLELYILDDFISMVNGQIEVLNTTNSTVDEWLLANTEGVSV